MEIHCQRASRNISDQKDCDEILVLILRHYLRCLHWLCLTVASIVSDIIVQAITTAWHQHWNKSPISCHCFFFFFLHRNGIGAAISEVAGVKWVSYRTCTEFSFHIFLLLFETRISNKQWQSSIWFGIFHPSHVCTAVMSDIQLLNRWINFFIFQWAINGLGV